ncbi:1-acyl-sn-glycerol-3-phosphate acyltransferase [Streptomyces sp. NPDC002779]|uniref:1-acyl-sn-glycerol-3-phosphate acyltransferase n=1 Tax=Streptomyces sp. NPDC002779 TaxID=3364664 RepID=UPI00369F035D
MTHRARTVSTIIDTPASQRDIHRLATRLGQGHRAMQREVRRHLRSMVAVRGTPWTDLFATLMTSLLTSTWTVHCAPDNRRRLSELDKAGDCLIFLPNHRTYADPLFVQRASQGCGLPRNLWFAGDNLRLPLLSGLARRAGVVFLRRTNTSDEVYGTALRCYLRHLVEVGENVEWYQEGGRSRTGLLRPPRHGLLRYTAEALTDLPGRRVWLVPVALSFEPLPDAADLAAEVAGAAKRPETLRWFLRYVRTYRAAAGTAHVRFSAPIPAHDGKRPADSTAAARAATLARDVNRALSRATPVTTRTLTALALAGWETDAVPANPRQRVRACLAAADRAGAPQTDTAILRTPDGIGRAIRMLYAAGPGPIGRARPDAPGLPLPTASEHPVPDTVPAMLTAPPPANTDEAARHATALYADQGVHWMWPRATAEVAALRASRIEEPLAWNRAVEHLRLLMRMVALGTGIGTHPHLLAGAIVELRRLAAPTEDGSLTPWSFTPDLNRAKDLIAPDVLHRGAASQLRVLRSLSQNGDEPPRTDDILRAALDPPHPDIARDTPLVHRSAPYCAAVLVDLRREGLLSAGREATARRAKALAEAENLWADLKALDALRAERTA